MENQNEITPIELSEKININEKDIENVFKTLISDGNVIDISDRQGIKIARDKKVNYSSLLLKEDNPTTTPIIIATIIGGVISKTASKIIIGTIIGILILVVWSIWDIQIIDFVKQILKI